MLVFSCFILYPKAKFSCYCRYLLTSYFCIPVPYNEKDIFCGVLILEGPVGISGWGINLDCCDIEWFALEMNRDHSVVFEIGPKYCISDSFVDYEGYSFSSTIVDIMVI